MSDERPGDSVFTTVAFRNSTVLAFSAHEKRLIQFAETARCPPLSSDIFRQGIHQGLEETNLETGLMRIRWSAEGKLSVDIRKNPMIRGPVSAISVPAPRWPRRFRGIKHGAWSAYVTAMENAERMGSDIALLIHDHCIVDGDRCTPILLDEDGVAYAPGEEQGAVASVTLTLIENELESAGIPLRMAWLTEELVRRCRELVVIGTGIGVVVVEEIDGHDIPVGNRLLDPIERGLKTAWSASEVR
ncbi:MAG: aminotransferase class IV [Candidatus Thermoplasmatota archaeon]|nr:aminotransferase class IV [Candidatus Thermoplasmatota archaeon]